MENRRTIYLPNRAVIENKKVLSFRGRSEKMNTLSGFGVSSRIDSSNSGLFIFVILQLGLMVPGLHVYPSAFLIQALSIVLGFAMGLHKICFSSVGVSVRHSRQISILLIAFLLILLLRSFSSISAESYIASFNYLARAIFFLMLYLVFSQFLRSGGLLRLSRVVDYFRSLFLVVSLFILIEIMTRGSSLTSFIDLYKARSDVGGIDTIHYNRLSGLFSFPGDLAIIIVLLIAVVPVLSNRSGGRFIFLIFLILSLYLTQSRAGFATFIFFLALTLPFLSWYLRVGVYVICIFIFSFIVIEFTRLSAGFYLLKSVSDPENFIKTSKRIQEFFSYFNASAFEVVFGVSHNSLHDFYEVETIGLFSRVGLVGVVLYLVLICHAVYSYILAIRFRAVPTVRVFFGLYSYWLSFLIVYCNISAGFSRAKLMIVTAAVLVMMASINRVVRNEVVMRCENA